MTESIERHGARMTLNECAEPDWRRFGLGSPRAPWGQIWGQIQSQIWSQIGDQRAAAFATAVEAKRRTCVCESPLPDSAGEIRSFAAAIHPPFMSLNAD